MNALEALDKVRGRVPSGAPDEYKEEAARAYDYLRALLTPSADAKALVIKLSRALLVTTDKECLNCFNGDEAAALIEAYAAQKIEEFYQKIAALRGWDHIGELPGPWRNLHNIAALKAKE